MKPKIKVLLLFAGVVFVLDVFTKWLIVKYLPMGDNISVIPHIFDIVHGRNTGAAFGLLSDWKSPLRNWFFYSIGALALVFLYYYTKSLDAKDKVSLVALGFIMGGASGNIFDRVLRGSVVDFLSFHIYDKVWNFTIFDMHVRLPLTWPAFNVADSAITVAVGMLVIQTIRSAKKG